MTALLGVIGDPVVHSLSPLIHNSWLRSAGLDAVYEALQVARGDLQPSLDALERRGALGFNITLPHKQEALKIAQKATPIAAKIGAANTLKRLSTGGWQAENTDYSGFLTALKAQSEQDIASKNVLVLGAGGAARAIVHALTEKGAYPLILNRTVDKAKALAKELGGPDARYGSLEACYDEIASVSLIINTLSLGHQGKYLDLPRGGERLFFDISYGAAAKAQLTHASTMGWRICDGIDMLVGQAAASFEIWFESVPETQPAIDRCRHIVEKTQ